VLIKLTVSSKILLHDSNNSTGTSCNLRTNGTNLFQRILCANNHSAARGNNVHVPFERFCEYMEQIYYKDKISNNKRLSKS